MFHIDIFFENCILFCFEFLFCFQLTLLFSFSHPVVTFGKFLGKQVQKVLETHAAQRVTPHQLTHPKTGNPRSVAYRSIKYVWKSRWEKTSAAKQEVQVKIKQRRNNNVCYYPHPPNPPKNPKPTKAKKIKVDSPRRRSGRGPTTELCFSHLTPSIVKAMAHIIANWWTPLLRSITRTLRGRRTRRPKEIVRPSISHTVLR